VRHPMALSVVALTTVLLFGCGRESSPSPMDRGIKDANQILKDVNKEIKDAGPAAGGMSLNVIQTGNHRLKTSVDATLNTWVKDEKAILTFADRTLTVDFDKEQVSLDDAEKVKLPAGTKEVAVRYAAGKLTVTADGTDVPVSSTPK
jgi:hypothetical protein